MTLYGTVVHHEPLLSCIFKSYLGILNQKLGGGQKSSMIPYYLGSHGKVVNLKIAQPTEL
eukprot:SAG11_NODE_44_length_20765_cov_5.183635_6_plen_60_part_00